MRSLAPAGMVASFTAAALAGPAACAPPSPPARELRTLPKAALDDPGTVVALANVASAPNVFHLTYPIFRGASDALCPTVTREPDGTVVREGGCTDEWGFTWTGTATVLDAEGEGNGDFGYRSFGWSMPWTCLGTDLALTVRFDGEVAVRRVDDRTRSFAVALLTERGHYDAIDCTPTLERYAVEYTGTFEDGDTDLDFDGRPDQRVWSGNGRIGLTGVGEISARTTGLVVNDLSCPTEALGGRLKLWSGLDCATVDYDGALDCDADSTVTWRYNGRDRGEIDGVPAVTSCSVRAPGRASRREGTGVALVAVVVLLLLAARLLRSGRTA